MIGTLINFAAILVGGLLGLLLRKGMKPSVSQTVMRGLGLSVTLIGVMGAIKTQNTLLIIISMVIGGVIGALIDIDRRVNQLGDYAQRKLTHGDDGSTFAKGFVTASLVFCVGAMAVVGALDSGIRGDHTTLIAKSALDGVASIVFASSLGPGVLLSAVPVLVYQGSVALLGTAIAPLLSETIVTEMSAVGGLLILGIGLNMLLDKDIKIANLLPALFVPLIYCSIFPA